MASRKRDRAVDRWSSLAPAAQNAAAGFQRLASGKIIRAQGEEAIQAGRKRPATWSRFLAMLDRKPTTKISRRGTPREANATPSQHYRSRLFSKPPGKQPLNFSRPAER
jgi:hypothetical protein